MTKNFKFKFKGDRNYVHGSDIVNELLKNFKDQDLQSIDIRFNGITTSNMLLLPNDEDGEAKVNISWIEDGRDSQYKLVETGDQVQERYQYNEKLISDNACLDLETKSAQLKVKTPYTFCENLIATNKFLLQSLYPEEVGKWYFTRIELDRIISDEEAFKIILVKKLGFRLTKSEIYISNEKVGNIYFSMVK